MWVTSYGALGGICVHVLRSVTYLVLLFYEVPFTIAYTILIADSA